MSLISRAFPELRRALLSEPFFSARRGVPSAWNAFDDPFFSGALQGRDPFGALLGAPMGGAVAEMKQPVADVKETEKEYRIEAEIPGVKKNDVEIELLGDNTVVLRGKIERTAETGTPPTTTATSTETQPTTTDQHGGQVAPRGETSWSSERVYGSFSRAWQFPHKVKGDEIRATLKEGVLVVNVPKDLSETGTRGKRIEVEE